MLLERKGKEEILRWLVSTPSQKSVCKGMNEVKDWIEENQGKGEEGQGKADRGEEDQGQGERGGVMVRVRGFSG